jgi:hypothetical protein
VIVEFQMSWSTVLLRTMPPAIFDVVPVGVPTPKTSVQIEFAAVVGDTAVDAAALEAESAACVNDDASVDGDAYEDARSVHLEASVDLRVRSRSGSRAVTRGLRRRSARDKHSDDRRKCAHKRK